jgi:hypothetical protein
MWPQLPWFVQLLLHCLTGIAHDMFAVEHQP